MPSVIPKPVERHTDPAQRFGLRVALFGIAVALFGIPFGLLLEQVTTEGAMVAWDTAAANHLHGWVRGNPLLISVLKVVSFLGTPAWFYLVVGATLVYLWRRKQHRLMGFLIAATLGGGIVDSIVKIVVDRNRPSLIDPIVTAHGQSFPSGHSMTSVVAYGALLLVFFPVLRRGMRIALSVGAGLLCLAIGFTRLALGVHYITDVLGGYVLGLSWLIACVAAFSTWRLERGRPPVKPSKGIEPEAKPALQVHGHVQAERDRG